MSVHAQPRCESFAIMLTSRSPLSITFSVWKALFLRESLSRIFSGRATAFWLVAEPLVHVAFLVLIFTVIRVRTISGIDSALWIVVGLLCFFFFRRTSEQVTSAIRSNEALFAYRQVKPIDSAFVRAGLEGFLMIVITLLVLIGMALLGHDVMPVSPLMIAAAVFGVWLIGLSFGLIASVAEELVPELGRVINLMMMPMYIASGVLLPIGAVSEPYRGWLLWNPLVHGLESARAGFSSYYHVLPDISLTYLYQYALVNLFFGLVLHRRFATKLVMQ